MFSYCKFILILTLIVLPIFSQTWQDDSLVVRQILDTNGLDTVSVDNIAKVYNGRINSLYFWDMPTFSILPKTIGKLITLTDLKIGITTIKTIPPEIGNLKLLRILDLHSNKLTTLPPEIGNLDSIMTMYIDHNEIISIPQEIGKLIKMYIFQLQNNKITSIPDGICNCESLKNFSADNNLISYIPENIGNIPAFHSIFLNNNKLKHVPNSLIPFGLDDVQMCYNDSLVFTPEQKTAWGVKDYNDYALNYCLTGINKKTNGKKSENNGMLQVKERSIVFRLLKNTHVRCEVYNMSGGLIQTLIDSDIVAGTHSIPWNKECYSAGVYTLRYNTGYGDLFSKSVVVK